MDFEVNPHKGFLGKIGGIGRVEHAAIEEAKKGLLVATHQFTQGVILPRLQCKD